MDPDDEILDALRHVIDGEFGRYLGEGIGAKEASRLVLALNERGVVLVLANDVPEVPELVTPVFEAGPLVTVNVNVSATPETAAELVDKLVAQADAHASRR